MISNKEKQIIIDTVSPYNPTKIGVFGSYARGDNTLESDLDILIDFQTRVNLLDIIGLEQELTEKLGVKVDLVTERSLHPNLRSYVLKDLKII